jgi:retinol dehydrogenase-12
MGLWEYIKGKPGASGFGSFSTAEDVTKGIDLSGKVAVVTGASSGIGEEAARVFALRGAHVVLAVRKVAAAEAVKGVIKTANPNAKVDIMELDLSSLQSVDKFVENFRATSLPLNILLNNAGVMMCPFTLSADGYELQFATNHLGHFRLTTQLLPVLKSTANSTSSESRIVMVSSMAHRHPYAGGIMFDGLNDEKKYNRMKAYGQSKLANILFTKELAKRLQDEGVTNVTINALCPGAIATNLQRHLGAKTVIDAMSLPLKPLMKSVPQGAATSCYVATSPQLTGVSGKYFTDCNQNNTLCKEAEDMGIAAQLWAVSEEMIAKKIRL